MALAGRQSRRGSRAGRWLVIGVVATLAVLLVDASLKSGSPSPVRDLNTAAWMDRVLPLIGQSTDEGNQINQVRRGALTMPATAISSQLHAAATAAAQNYRKVIGLRPPADVNAAGGLLEACLLVRSQSASAMAGAYDQALSSAPPQSPTDPAVQAIVDAGRDFEVADRAYQLFLGALPTAVAKPTNSVWVPDPSQYDPGNLVIFLTSLRNATNLTPVHQVTVVAVTTTPASVSTQGSVEVLPPSKQIGVSIVLADTGNQAEKNLTVTATIAPSAGASSVRDFVSLTAGSAQSLSIGPLNPPLGVPVTLTVTVTGGTSISASKAITIEMPGPNAPITTTTTTVPSPSTTVPGVATTTPG